MRTNSPFGVSFGPRMGAANRVPLRSQFLSAPTSNPPGCVKVTTVKRHGMIISTILEPYQTRGYRIYNIPTGELVDAGLPTEFKVADVWACPGDELPPGYVPPKGKPGSDSIPIPAPPGPGAGAPPAPTVAIEEDTAGLAVGGGIIAALVAALALG